MESRLNRIAGLPSPEGRKYLLNSNSLILYTNAKSIDEKTKNKEGQKMVTFEDETKPGTEEQILKADDVFMWNGMK